MRLGIATGLVVVGDLIGEGSAQEQSVVGETPNLAARLQGLAAPGTLIVADTTRRQLGGLFEFEDLGSQSLAGFAEPQHVWLVSGESGIVSRFEALRSPATRLVGRDEELELLCRRWQQARLGEGRVVLISGEPGIGNIWHFGITAVLARLQAQTVPIEAFTAKIAAEQIPRVRGTAVFLTRTQRGAPPVMVWHVRRNRALHEHLFVLTIVTESVPWVGNSERLTVEEQAPCFWRAAAHFGFMERPDIPAVLRVAHQCG